MTRSSVLKIAAVVTAVPVIALLGLVLYLQFADLSGWRDTVAEKVSQSLGRKITIAGEFEPEVGLTTRLTAGDITLANPGWSNDPAMASIQSLTIELRWWSLVSGPLTFHDIEIYGARILLEKDVDGRANWAFDTGKSSKPSSGPVELVLQHALLEDVQLTWREPSRTATLEAEITHFETTEDRAGMLDLEFEGGVNDQQIELSGRLGTLNGLLNAAAVEYDLTGTLDGVRFSSKGDIKELKTLGGVDVTADVHGDDLADLRDLINLPPELEGPFSVSAAVSPATAGSGLRLDATGSGITAKVDGTVDSLLKPKMLDATVTASGPSIRTLGALTGVTNLPDDQFSVSGGVRWEGFPVTFRKVDITVGDNTLSMDGVLGAPPEMMGSDFSLEGQGPDLSTIGALAGIDLPRDRFSIEGRVVRVDGGIEVEKLDARIGRAVVTASGTVGDPPDYAGTTLTIHVEGPNIARFNHLIGVELPAQPFTIDGRFAQGNEAITLEGVSAQVGGTSLRVEGSLKTGKGLTGTSLRIDAKGTDSAHLRALVRLDDLPAEAWSAVGGLDVLDSGLHLKGVSVSVGSLHARADGRMGTARSLVGTDLQLHAEDPDLAHAMPIFGVHGFPQVPIRVDGRLRVEESGIRLDGTTATVGKIDVAVDGLIGTPELDGTNGHVSVRGPRLSSLGVFFHQPDFPNAPFSVEGNLH
ncbi:MAG: AsmA family protein, partial [Thermoanaerobaculales bacterium]|nr:AsmA family protein [Thermoanaerobaculales bacterium]